MSLLEQTFGELVGTSALLLMGEGVIANVVLSGTKGHNAGWMAINFGWGLAVFVGVIVGSVLGPAHLNPAVTFASCIAGHTDWVNLAPFVAAQMVGSMTGSFMTFLVYYDHFKETEDQGAKLAVFSTGPAIRNVAINLLTETVATFVLCFCALGIAGGVGQGTLSALNISFVVVAIGLSLGGPTGYAINPARDLGPRIMHQLLPIPKKGDSDWGYSWIPVVGGMAGGGLAGFLMWSLTKILDKINSS